MRAFAVLGILSLVFISSARAEQVIPVWNGPAPGSESWTYAEESNASERDKSLNFRNIVTPTITVYPAAKPSGTGMLVIPGGGFRNLGYGKEGEDIARWLNSQGITAFVLKYRLARTGDEDAKNLNTRIFAVIPMAVADATQAMRLLKSRAMEWGIKPGRFGAMGFSAGGYLTWNLGVTADLTARPDFIVPVYAGTQQLVIAPPDAPPAFLVLAEDDRYGTDGSLQLYKAWHDAKRPVELHLFAKGNHGFAMRKTGLPVDSWPQALQAWMTDMGYLPKTP